MLDLWFVAFRKHSLKLLNKAEQMWTKNKNAFCDVPIASAIFVAIQLI